MPDSIYDKLGEFLNDVLESGKIKENSTENIQEENQKRCDFNSNSQKEFEKKEFTSFNFNNSYKEKVTGTVYKANNYLYIYNYPDYIKKALSELNITDFSNINLKIIKKAYRITMKQNHPDMKNNTTSEKITNIINSYEILLNYFKN